MTNVARPLRLFLEKLVDAYLIGVLTGARLALMPFAVDISRFSMSPIALWRASHE